MNHVRILFHVFITGTPRAAGNQQTIRVAYYLARAGAEVTLYVGTWYFRSSAELMSFFGFTECERFNVVIQATPKTENAKGRAAQFRGAMFHLGRLMRLLFTSESRKYDVFFARGYRFPSLHVFFRRLLGYKVVFELHEIKYLDKVPEEQLFSVSPVLDFERYTFLNADGRLAITQTLLDFATKKWGAAEPAKVIHSCAIPFASDPLPQSRRLSNVCYIGNFYPLGGLDFLVQAMQFVPQARLTVVGGGGENDPDTIRIRALVDKCNVADRVELAGFLEPSRLQEAYAAADILVMPLADFVRCRYWMSPLKLFEYLNARRPIVASDHPVVREILTHESNALLVKPEDVQGFGRAIARLIDDPELAYRLAEAAYTDSRKYSMDNKVSQILEFIDKEVL